jgi:hypothetical protein
MAGAIANDRFGNPVVAGGGQGNMGNILGSATYGGFKGVDANTAAQLSQKDKIRDSLLSLLGIKKGGSLADSPLIGMGANANTGVGGIYNDLLGRAENTQTIQRGLVSGFGDSFRNQINSQFDASLGSATAALEDRGLGSSNLLSSTVSANEQARAQTQLSLEDTILQQKLGVEQGTYQNIADVQSGRAGSQQSFMQALLGILG